MIPANALTVDVEDYYHVSAFAKDIRVDQWDSYPSRVVVNTRRILDLLDAHDVRATFFVLGWVAERFEALVREIHDRGHEIGCHGYAHRLIYQLTPDEFRADLVRARDILQETIDGPVRAFRAPSFSITKESLWALEILVEEGFHFDSSIFPIHHDRYGIPGATRGIHRIDTPSGPIQEFPISVARLAGINVPVSGGGYFRLYPLCLTSWLLGRINRRHARPFVFYVHPWEVDPRQPRLQAGSRLSRFRHYVNLASTHRKLDLLLNRFAFAPLGEVVRGATVENDEEMTP